MTGFSGDLNRSEGGAGMAEEVEKLIESQARSPLSLHLDGWGNFNAKNDAPKGWRKLHNRKPQHLSAACRTLKVPCAFVVKYTRYSDGYEQDCLGVIVPEEDAPRVAQAADLIDSGYLKAGFQGLEVLKPEAVEIVVKREG